MEHLFLLLRKLRYGVLTLTKFTNLELEALYLPLHHITGHSPGNLALWKEKKEKRKKCLYRIRKKLSVEGITEQNQQPRIVSALETEEHLGTHSLMKRTFELEYGGRKVGCLPLECQGKTKKRRWKICNLWDVCLKEIILVKRQK